MKKRFAAYLTAALLLCTNLIPLRSVIAAAEEYEIPEFVIEDGVLLEYTGSDSEVHVPEDVTEIGENAFLTYDEPYDLHLTDEQIAHLDREYAENTFSSCICKMNTTLETVYLPKSLRRIGAGAFQNATALKNVYMQEGLAEIAANAFAYDKSELTRFLSCGNGAFIFDNGDRWHKDDPDYEEWASYYVPHLKTLHLPDSVKTIGTGAFQDSAITSIEIPEGVTEIAPAAFLNTPLESVVIPESVTAIGDMAFANTKLTSVTLPSHLQKLGVGAFMGSSLEEINLPDGLTEIPRGAFQHTALKEIVIPDTVTTIGERAFQGTKLESLVIPEGVTTIGADAFQGSALRTVQLADSLESVAPSAFENTPFLQTGALKSSGGWLLLPNGTLINYVGDAVNAVIPAAVKKIAAGAFNRCARLKTLTVPDTVETVENGAVVNCDLRCVYSTNPAAKQLTDNVIAAPEIPPEKGKCALDLSKDTWSFANLRSVFGNSYELTDDAKALLKQVLRVPDLDAEWYGSCYGLSLTVLLAKNGLIDPAQIRQGAQSLTEIEPEQAVRNVVNYYQLLHDSDAANKICVHPTMREDDYFEQMISLGWEAEQQGKPFLMIFATPTGSHACVGCGIESGKWEWDGKAYDRRILLWDPNCPDQIYDDACFYYRQSDYAYCIPRSKVLYVYGGSENKGRMTTATDEIEALGSPAYPFAVQTVQGDLNGDSAVSIADAVLLSRYLLTADAVPAARLRAADLNGDKCVNAADLTLLKRQILAAAG